MKNILEALNWRYATKKFDTGRKLTDTQLNTLTEAIRLSASSFGLQPWKFIVVSNPEVRARLREAAWGQPQITDASQLIVFAIRKDLNATIDAFMRSTAEIRGVSPESLEGRRENLKKFAAGKTPEAAKEWASRQIYIALGTLLTTAAHEGIDACPMEGFDPKKFDEILGLEKLRLESRVIAAVGYRADGDPLASLPKVRFPREEVIIEVR